MREVAKDCALAFVVGLIAGATPLVLIGMML